LRIDTQRDDPWSSRALVAHGLVAERKVLQPLPGKDVGISRQGPAAVDQFPDIFISHGFDAMNLEKAAV
jgi:hypothetical protein